MTIRQRLVVRKLIAQVAKQQGKSFSQCRSEIEEVIAAAWATTDPEAKQRQIQLVGEGRVPSPEELIFLIADLVR
jgi:hypothetical protein